MKIALVWIGKTVAPYLVEAVNDYVKRVRFYTPFEVVEVPGLKNTKALSVAQQRDKEGELLLKTIEPTDVVVLTVSGRGDKDMPTYINYKMTKA